MLRKSLQHICPSVEIEAALITIGQPVTVSGYNNSFSLKLIYLFIYFYLLLLFNYFTLFLLQARPEELTLDDFVSLHNLIAKN